MFFRLFSLSLVLFSFGAFAQATIFEVTDNEAQRVIGTIAEWNPSQIVLNTQGKSQTIPLEKLVKIRNLAPEQNTFPNSVIALELTDGSRLSASSFTIEKSQGVCRLLDGEKDLTIPLSALSAVRFTVRNMLEVAQPPADWQRLAVHNTQGDKLIVGNPGAFDVYSGILNGVSAETVSFSVDGEVLPVPRQRVYGLVFHGESTPSALTTPVATLMLSSGMRGMVADFQWRGNELSWTTTVGVSASVPLSMVNEIDFGEKGVAYLFDFERARNEFSLPIAANIPSEQLKLLQTFYESRTKVTRRIVLDGVTYKRGITLLGKATLEYALPQSFASLKAVIGIEDQFCPFASARLQILADSQVLGTWELRGDAPAQQIQLNLPQNCRLITIITEPIPQLGVASVLTIADPKLFE